MHYLSDQRWRSAYGVAAVCAELVARGEVRMPGVHTPEMLDPSVVVPALDTAGFRLEEFPADDAPELRVPAVSLRSNSSPGSVAPAA